METIVILLIILVAFDLAALKWGFDSRDKITRGERQPL